MGLVNNEIDDFNGELSLCPVQRSQTAGLFEPLTAPLDPLKNLLVTQAKISKPQRENGATMPVLESYPGAGPEGEATARLIRIHVLG